MRSTIDLTGMSAQVRQFTLAALGELEQAIIAGGAEIFVTSLECTFEREALGGAELLVVESAVRCTSIHVFGPCGTTRHQSPDIHFAWCCRWELPTTRSGRKRKNPSFIKGDAEDFKKAVLEELVQAFRAIRLGTASVADKLAAVKF